MRRIILTFETTHKVLAAEKELRKELSKDQKSAFKVRPTPTPPHLSNSVCGMSLEITDRAQRQAIVSRLRQSGIEPSGIHEID